MSERKIVTSFVYPPIPHRNFDWCAHFDDPEGVTGWGANEQEAIDDLLAEEEFRLEFELTPRLEGKDMRAP